MTLQLKTSSHDPADLKALLQETHNEALIQNEYATSHWLKIRDEHMALHSHLSVLPDKLSQEVMVPIGSKALMRGKMVHTNEILVCLGDGWFVKQSAKEAAAICDRRIKLCENMLKDLEREKDLLTNRKNIPLERDAFGGREAEEILEPYDEDKEAQWKVEHRKKEQEYRKKLAEIRNQEKTAIEDGKSLWKRLDELELQEELQEELDRLHAERAAMGYEDDEEDDESDEEDEEMEMGAEESVEEQEIQGGNGLVRNISAVEPATQSNSRTDSNSENQKSSGRRVSFADERTSDSNRDSDVESDSSAEILTIEFHHSSVGTKLNQNKITDVSCIQTPGDIYNYVKDCVLKNGAPKSILKNKTDVSSCGDAGSERMRWLDQPDSVPIVNEDLDESISNVAGKSSQECEIEEQPVVFGDILEHKTAEMPQPTEPTHRTSLFKAKRMAARR